GAAPAAERILTLTGAISGAGGLTVNAPGGTVTLGGTAANTFTGLTSVTAGTLVLNKGTNIILALGGNLSVGNAASPGAPGSAAVQLNKDLSIPSLTGMTVFADGLFNVNGTANDIGTLTMTGGEIRLGGHSNLGLNSD